MGSRKHTAPGMLDAPANRLLSFSKRKGAWLGLVALSAFCTTLSFPPYGGGLWMLVGLAPLFMAVETARTWKQAVFRAWVWGFLSNILVCSWVATSVQELSGAPIALGVICLLALSVFEQSSWALFFGLRHFVHKRLRVQLPLWTPLAIYAVEVFWPKYFPSTLGNVFYGVPWLAQAADVAGVWGLTALIALSNEVVAMAMLGAWSGRALARHGAIAVFVLIAAASYGSWRLNQVRDLMSKPSAHVRVALVQPNVNGVMKVKAELDRDQARMDLLRFMLKLTDRAVSESSPDVVIWPETAHADTYHGESALESRGVTDRLDRYLSEIKIPLIFGARDQAGSDRFNALFLAQANGELAIERYHKKKLLEFTEHVPGSEIFPSLKDVVRRYGGTAFSTGRLDDLFGGPRGVRFGPMICLEGLYPWLARDLALKGADVLVNATNDAWFGDTREPDLHLRLTAFRSIETRRPFIRSTNTGYSAIIDIDGSLRFKSGLFTEEVLRDDVPLYSGVESPFLAFGKAFPFVFGAYVLFPIVIWHARRVKPT